MCGRFTFDGQQWPELVASIEKPEIERITTFLHKVKLKSFTTIQKR